MIIFTFILAQLEKIKFSNAKNTIISVPPVEQLEVRAVHTALSLAPKPSTKPSEISIAKSMRRPRAKLISVRLERRAVEILPR